MTPGRLLLGLAVALLAVAQPLAWAARKSDPDKLPSIRVQDLHYGDVLFHFWADEDSGSASLSAGCCLNVVVTIRKISSTTSTSIRATMMTAGAVRRLRTRKRIKS